MGNTSCVLIAALNSSVHPHTHGEHTPQLPFQFLILGSSPHAWGTLLDKWEKLPEYRFIPTRMGNTGTTAHVYVPVSVHPHTHGEHHSDSWCHRKPFGSSPHAWGTHVILNWNGVSHRFIPTRMGNTSTTGTASPSGTVHPHTHGEHVPCLLVIPGECGSSPHAWGTPGRCR